jgi:hypothetical protein
LGQSVVGASGIFSSFLPFTMTMMSDFGGEDFLQVKLPNYSQEQSLLTLWILAATFFWVLVVPFFLASSEVRTVEKQVQVPVAQKNGTNSKTNNGKSSKTRATTKQVKTETTLVREEVVVRWVPLPLTCAVSACYMVCVLYLIMTRNPSNYHSSRRVFQAPLLTQAECQRIIDMSMAAAQRNYEQAIDPQTEVNYEQTTAIDVDPQAVVENSGTSVNKTRHDWQLEPVGWHKSRHGNYPTTDLNLVTDPFSKQDREWLGDLLDRRLAPTLARIYGIPPSSIRANDMFVVRYDEGQRIKLDNHTDDGDISFNVLLNGNFTGGGTRFWDRTAEAPFGLVQPTRPGQFLSHNALINHEGNALDSGTRIIFVGFLSVDRMEPFTMTPTGMNWYTTWMSLPWMHVKLKEGYHIAKSRLDRNKGKQTKWGDNVYMRALFRDMFNFLEVMGDIFGTYGIENLVDELKADDYLAALDDAYEESTSSSTKKANWFQGQMLNIDIDGTIDSQWRSRRENSERFSEL